MYSGLTVNATNSDENLSELHLQINSGKDSEVCPKVMKVVNREQLMMKMRKREDPLSEFQATTVETSLQ